MHALVLLIANHWTNGGFRVSRIADLHGEHGPYDCSLDLIKSARRNEKPRASSARLSADVSSVLALVAKEDAVTLGPAFLRRKAPDAAVVPVTDKGATRNLFLVWQRRQTTEALRTLLDTFPFQAQSSE